MVFQAYITVYSLSWQSVVVHSQNVPEPSQYSLFYDMIYLLQLCLRPDPYARLRQCLYIMLVQEEKNNLLSSDMSIFLFRLL